jgi:SAM-dependent methyltransferase
LSAPAPWVFDQEHYDALNAAREETVLQLLPELKKQLNLRTALDLGCGLGHYSEVLHKQGLHVLGVDGRLENVQEARRRYPHLEFRVADAQDPALVELGSFDLVFCFGLLYHLENPFRVIRSIAALTSGLALLEGMVYPTPEPAMVLLDERPIEDQGLEHLAFYPSETCLVKMLRRSGLGNCYMPKHMPPHTDFQRGNNGFRRRTLLAASGAQIDSPSLISWPDPSPLYGPLSMLPLYPVRRAYSKAVDMVDHLLFDKTRKLDRY